MNNKVVDSKGYQKDNINKDSPYKVINSNRITMKKVDKKILAIKLDKDGLPIGMKFMDPGKEYNFEDAEGVLEIPKYQSGIDSRVNYKDRQYKPNTSQHTVDIVGFDPMDPFGYNKSRTQPQVESYGTPGAMLSLDANGNPVSVPSQQFPMGQEDTQKMIGAEQKLSQGFAPYTTMGQVNTPSTNDSGGVPTATLNDVDTEVSRPKVETASLTPVAPHGETKALGEPLPKPSADTSGLGKTVNSEDELNMRERPQIQFFNPYGGVDIPGAATGLGASIENKNTWGIVGNAAKLATGLGRNVVGGMGTQKANNLALEEYYKNQKKGLDGPVKYIGQKGGEFTEEDLASINDSTGVNFDLEGVNSLFERVPIENKEPTIRTEDIDYGWYKGAGYFDVNQIDGDTVVLNNTAKNPHNAATIGQTEKYLRSKNPNTNITVNYVPGLHMQKGGRVTEEQLLTGEYIQGVDQDDKDAMQMVNGEVEAGEYLQTPQGDIAEVVGQKHKEGENSGEKLPMEVGDRVLTDDTKLGAANAKHIRDNYDIEVRAKDTYSKVLDKFRSKIGLDNLVKEEEKLLKKLDEQGEEEQTDTVGLNMHFLNNRIAEIREQKAPIEQARKILYDKLFSMQESDKPKEKQEENKFQGGGQNRERFKGWYENARSHGFDGEVNLDVEDLGAEAGKIQQWMISNKPEEVVKYFRSGQPMTSKGIDYLKKTVPQLFSSTGMPIDKPSGQWTPEERAQLYSAIKDTKLDTDEFWLDQFNDNMWEHRGPLLGSNLQGNSISNISPSGQMMPGIDVDMINEKPFAEVSRVPGTEDNKRGGDNRKALNVIGLPDQYPMVPGGMEPHLKNQRRFDMVDAPKINVEPYMQKIYAQENAAKAQSEGYTPAVKAAIDANITSNTQQALSDTAMKIDAQNIGTQFNAEVQNAQTQRMQENARVNDNLSYEQRQLMAKAKTEEEYKNYFDKTQAVNMGNYATINALNNANARYSDIAFDGNGYITSPSKVDSGTIEFRLRQLMEEEEARKKKESKSN